MRGGGLTAYRAVNIAAAHWKFARKLARPPSFVRMALAKIWGFSSLMFSGSGGLGLRLEALCIFRAFHLRPPSLATAGSARTRLGN